MGKGRRIRKSRQEERRDLDLAARREYRAQVHEQANRPSTAEMIASASVAGSLVLQHTIDDHILHIPINNYNEPLGIALTALGVGYGTYSGLKNVRTRTGIATAETYGSSRHPMYLGWRIYSAGIVINNPSVKNASAALALYLITELAARLEEKKLDKRFGEVYKKYAENVPRWIPNYLTNPLKKLVWHISSRNQTKS